MIPSLYMRDHDWKTKWAPKDNPESSAENKY